MQKNPPQIGALFYRIIRLASGFLAVLLLLVIFERITFLDALLVGCAGIGVGVFIIRKEVLTILHLKHYFRAKAGADNPAEFTPSNDQRLRPTYGDETELSELVWTISSAEQQAFNSARHLKLNSQYRYELLYNLPLPLIILNEEGQVSEFNKQAKTLFDHIDIGKPIAFIIRDNDVIDTIREVNKGALSFNEIQFTLGFSHKRHFAVLISNFSADAQSRTAISFIDRTMALEAEKMRADFVANVSHELRTPLTSILGFIETLQGPAGAEKKTREKFLTILQQQAERIFRLATDQLSLARIEQTEQQAPAGNSDLVMICERVITALESQAQAANITLKFTKSVKKLMIKGSTDELLQMVQNLAENAIRYGRPNGRVEILLEARATHPENPKHPVCCIRIKDDGEGIDPVHLPRLTERFYRVDKDRSRIKGGTGLGLAIVKHIIQHHRGYLHITSEPGKGSVFSVYLPID